MAFNNRMSIIIILFIFITVTSTIDAVAYRNSVVSCQNSYQPCNWNSWTQFGPCKDGTQYRYRSCPVQNRCMGGLATDTQYCKMPPPVYVRPTQMPVYTQAPTTKYIPPSTAAPVYTIASTKQTVYIPPKTTKYIPPSTAAPVYTIASTKQTVYIPPKTTAAYRPPPTPAPVYTTAQTTAYQPPVYTQPRPETTTPYQVVYTTANYQKTTGYSPPPPQQYISRNSGNIVSDENMKVAREEPATSTADPSNALTAWEEWSEWTECGVTNMQYRTRACPSDVDCGTGLNAEAREC